MNQQKKYFLNLSILLFLVALSSSIIALATVIPKSLTTIAKVDFEIDRMKKEIRQQRAAELTRIKNKKILEKLEKKAETAEDKLTEFDLIMQIRSAQTTEENYLIRRNAANKQRLAETTGWFESLNSSYAYYYVYYSYDPNMPRPIADALYKCIQEEGINPHNIKLEYFPNPENEPNLRAIARYDFKFKTSSTPETIIIYEALTMLPENVQRFIFKHELMHLLLLHNLEEALTKRNYNNPNLDVLNSIHEIEADIHAASKSLELADAGMKYRCTYSHPQILDHNNHCKEMTLMYELMKRKEELS
jgi:hypothetical protein